MRPAFFFKALVLWIACVVISFIVAELASDSVDFLSGARSTVLARLPDRILIVGEVLRPLIHAVAVAVTRGFQAFWSHQLILLAFFMLSAGYLVFLGVSYLAALLNYLDIPVGPFFCCCEVVVVAPGLAAVYTSNSDDDHRHVIPYLPVQMTMPQLCAVSVGVHALALSWSVFVNHGLLRRIRRALAPNTRPVLCETISKLSVVNVVTVALLSFLFLGVPAIRISCVAAPLTATSCPVGAAVEEPSTLCMAVLGIDSVHPMKTYKGVTCTTTSCRLDAFDYLDRDIIASGETADP